MGIRSNLSWFTTRPFDNFGDSPHIQNQLLTNPKKSQNTIFQLRIRESGLIELYSRRMSIKFWYLGMERREASPATAIDAVPAFRDGQDGIARAITPTDDVALMGDRVNIAARL